MLSLKDCTVQELEKELELRKQEEKNNNIPKALGNPDFSKLIQYVDKNIHIVAEEGYPEKDFDHYVFETVMECIYGKNVWKWWNANCDG